MRQRELIDRSRMLARRLARTCRVLAAMQAVRLIDDNWAAAWERVRTEVAGLFAGSGLVSEEPEYPVPCDERITLTDLGTRPTDRVTPILPRAVVDEPSAAVTFTARGSVRVPSVAGG